MPEVELWEAAALSLDIDPDVMGIIVTNNTRGMPIKDAFNGMPKSFIDRLEIIDRSAGNTLNTGARDRLLPWRSRVPLSEFVSWCVKTKLQISNELADKHDGNKTPPPPDFDKANPKYPPELDLALQAWRAISTTEGKGKPKGRIKAWLGSNTKLSEEAKTRISIVANWDKSGGATSTD